MMFIFMGTYSGGDSDSPDDDDSQDDGANDDHTQTGVNDYTGDDDSGDESGSGAGAAAGVAGGAGAAAGAGGSAGGGSGAGAGTVTEPPEGDDSGDADESDEGEASEDEEEEQPESPDIEEPDIEEPDREPEDDVGEPETDGDTKEEEDVEEPDVEEPEDNVDEPDDREDADGQEDDEDDEDDDEEEEEEVQLLVQEVDPLSAMSWCVQPVMKRVEECYGEDIEFFYKPAPVREFEDPEHAKQKWMECSEEMGMPVDPSFWDNDPPESTETVNKAFQAAIQQGRGNEYIRAMWRRTVAAGRDINDEEVLVELADDLGLDPEQFEEDLNEVELETGDRGELPSTLMQLDIRPASWNGRVRYSDFDTEFTFQGIPEEDPQEPQGFVEEHGPVATPEVMEVHGFQREEVEQRLQDLDGVSSFEVGSEDFWTV